MSLCISKLLFEATVIIKPKFFKNIFKNQTYTLKISFTQNHPTSAILHKHILQFRSNS